MATDLVDQPVMQREQLDRTGQEPLSFGGQGDPPGRAHEQPRPQLALQPGDVAAQRLLGNVEASGGPPEVQLVGHGDEAAQQPRMDVGHNPSTIDNADVSIVVGPVLDTHAWRGDGGRIDTPRQLHL